MQNHRCRRRITGRGGAACVEFAIVAPFIFMLVFGSIEFSRIVMIKQALTNAAREGARKAALVNTINASDVDTVVRQCLSGTIAGSNSKEKVQVSVSPSTLSGLSSGTVVTTSISVDSAEVSWLPAMLFAKTTISSAASMKRE